MMTQPRRHILHLKLYGRRLFNKDWVTQHTYIRIQSGKQKSLWNFKEKRFSTGIDYKNVRGNKKQKRRSEIKISGPTSVPADERTHQPGHLCPCCWGQEAPLTGSVTATEIAIYNGQLSSAALGHPQQFTLVKIKRQLDGKRAWEM